MFLRCGENKKILGACGSEDEPRNREVPSVTNVARMRAIPPEAIVTNERQGNYIAE